MYVIVDKNTQLFNTKAQAEQQLKQDQIVLKIQDQKDIDIILNSSKKIHNKNTNNALSYTIYCDGSYTSSTPKQTGGWAYKILETQEEKNGHKHYTTQNQMELSAAIMALSRVPAGAHVKIFTDSRYVIDGITRYIKNWKVNGWKTTSKKAVLNQDLWKALDKLCENKKIEWNWVKGHSDDPHNDRVDYLAKLSYK